MEQLRKIKVYDNFCGAREAARNLKGYPAARAIQLGADQWAVEANPGIPNSVLYEDGSIGEDEDS